MRVDAIGMGNESVRDARAEVALQDITSAMIAMKKSAAREVQVCCTLARTILRFSLSLRELPGFGPT
jgi:hypothetical protein